MGITLAHVANLISGSLKDDNASIQSIAFIQFTGGPLGS